MGRLVWLCAGLAHAQSTTSTILGHVRAETQAALPGAEVTARHVESGLVRAATSDETGHFTLAALPVGTYEVHATLDRFRPLVRPGIRLVVGEPVVLNLTLVLGGAEDEITVTQEVSAVRTRSGELSYLVSAETIRDLPLNGRNYTDLAFLQPGVIAFPYREGGSVVAHGLAASVNGQDPRSNVYLLDGTLMNDFTNSPAGSAAGTTLGTETVREFRVEANAYGAEFGRSPGGQINVITKSGTNDFHGSAYEFHRNDALDARNYYDPVEKPDFRRNQFGFTLGGPVRRDRTFFFVGYEGLRESLGRTISTVVPNEAARSGVLPAPGGGTVGRAGEPATCAPTSTSSRCRTARSSAEASPPTASRSRRRSTRTTSRSGSTRTWAGTTSCSSATRTTGPSSTCPPTFPSSRATFVSRNQFATAEYRRVFSARTLGTFRLGYSRTRIGQEVEANTSQPLSPFVPGRESLGAIDIGGVPRFGPQVSADVSIRQDVFAFNGDFLQTRGRHSLKAGVLVERYQSNETNPTFSRGIHSFANLEGFLRGRSLRFIGLTPEGDLERAWPHTLLGLYVQDEVSLTERLTLNAGLRYEYATLPRDEGNRDVNMPDLLAPQVTVGPLYENPTGKNVSPRLGFAWDVFGDGRTALRGGYGLYFNTMSHQNLIVTVTNPPATPRPVIPNPTFPVPDFSRLGALSIRPIQYDIELPRMHVWNVSLQRQLPGRVVATVGYAGTRGRNLWRNGDANVPVPETLADGTLFHPATAARPNASFSAIELKSSDGRSWYDALIVELRRASSGGIGFQSSYTFSRNIDTTQASTFFSDATNGTVSWFPEAGQPDYNKGLADYHAKHNWVFNVTYDLPFARESEGLARALFGGWQIAAIGQVKSGPPLTLFVQTNRSRSRWSPSLGPGQGFDRPSLAPGRTPESAINGTPEQWFDPTAFVLQPAGTYGNLGRGALVGPGLAVLDLALVKRVRWARLGPAGEVELRAEAFNVLNHTNFGVPSLQAFAGTTDGEAPLPTLGRIRATATSSRQVQLGVRVRF